MNWCSGGESPTLTSRLTNMHHVRESKAAPLSHLIGCDVDEEAHDVIFWYISSVNCWIHCSLRLLRRGPFTRCNGGLRCYDVMPHTGWRCYSSPVRTSHTTECYGHHTCNEFTLPELKITTEMKRTARWKCCHMEALSSSTRLSVVLPTVTFLFLRFTRTSASLQSFSWQKSLWLMRMVLQCSVNGSSTERFCSRVVQLPSLTGDQMKGSCRLYL